MKNPSFRKCRMLFPLFGIAFVALLTLAVRALWNGVLVDILAVKAVTYWQALGILALAKILFGGIPRRRGGRFGRCRNGMIKEYWSELTPEQKEKMREEMRHHFGDWPRPPWCDGDPEQPEATPKK